MLDGPKSNRTRAGLCQVLGCLLRAELIPPCALQGQLLSLFIEKNDIPIRQVRTVTDDMGYQGGRIGDLEIEV